jgi:hypothetical protein
MSEDTRTILSFSLLLSGLMAAIISTFFKGIGLALIGLGLSIIALIVLKFKRGKNENRKN